MAQHPTYPERPFLGDIRESDEFDDSSATATVRFQLSRVDKLLGQLNESIGDLMTKVEPLTTPPSENMAMAGPTPGLAQDRIQASEMVNHVWDIANRLEGAIRRLNRTTKDIEL